MKPTAPGNLPRAPPSLPPRPPIRLICLHFLRERTRHHPRHGLLRRRRGLDPPGRLALDVVIAVDAGPRRDEIADDDVLLHAQLVVSRAPNRRVGQDPGGLLERGRRDERLRREARLRDAEQQGLVRGDLAAFGLRAVVHLVERELVHVLAFEELGIPRVHHLHLLQHLAHDHADVLVVDLHTLQAVHLLHLVQQVLLHRPRALDPQDVVRVHGPLGEAVSGAHPVALMDAQVLAGRHLVQLRLALFGMDVDLALAALDVTEPHGAVDLGDGGRVLGPPRLEQLGHPGQAARDVARLVGLPRHLGEYQARVHLLAVLDGELRPFGNDEVAQPLLLFTLLLDDLDVRVQLLVPVLDDDALAPARELVELFPDGFLLDDVDEAHHPCHVGHDRVGVRVPREQHAVPPHLLAVLDHHRGAERHVEARVHRELALLAGAVLRRPQNQLALVARDHALLVGCLDEGEAIAVLDDAFHLGLAHRLLRDARRRAADVEGAQRELRARLPNRLGSQDPHRFAQIDHVHGRQVAAVAHPAHAALRLAREHRPDAHRLDPRILDGLCGLLGDELARFHQHLGPLVLVELVRIRHLVERHAPHQALAQRLDDVFAFLERGHLETEDRAAVLLGDRHVLRHVHQAASQVARVRRLQGGVGEALARAVRRDEVLEHGEAFPEVRLDRALDDLADAAGELLLRLRHQAAHPRQLPDLVARAAAPGVEHHEHRVEAALGPLHRLDHRVGDVVVRVRPGVDHLVVALAEGDLAGSVGALEPLDPRLGVVQQRRLFRRDLEILAPDRDAPHRGVPEAELLQEVEELDRAGQPGPPVALEHQLREVLLAHDLVLEPLLTPQPFGEDAVEDHPPHGRVDPFTRRLAPVVQRRVVGELLGRESHVELGERRDAGRPRLDLGLLEIGRLLREEVATQHHVLRRLGDGSPVGRLEDVVRGNHQEPRLDLALEGERHVHGHLVAVEVRVERRAHERMDPDRLAFHEDRLERLDAQAVQRRRAVQQHGMVLDDLLEDLVHLRRLLLHDLLRPFHRLRDALLHELVDDEGLEQLHRHRLGEPALVQPELRTHDDHRPAGIVHALAQQVLAEPPLLALEHVGERLERSLTPPANRLGATAVVEQRVHRLLQHPLLVPEDDLRRPVQDQLLQPVVTIDDAAVQVVQVRRREPPAVQRHQRPQVGRDDRDHVQDHPLRVVAPLPRGARVAERVHDLEALQHLLLAVLARLGGDRLAQLVGELVDGEPLEQGPHRGRADVRLEGGVALGLRLGTELEEAVFVEQLLLLHFLLARVDHHVVRVVDHPLEIPQRHVEQIAHRRRQRLEEPDVRHRDGELDVPHALAPHLGQRHLDATAVADHAAVPDALVLAAVALPVLHRAEDALAEQPVPLRLEGAVVDGLGLRYLAPRPPGALALQLQTLALLGVARATDLLWGGDPDLDIVEARALWLAPAPEIDHPSLPLLVTLQRLRSCPGSPSTRGPGVPSPAR